LISPVAGSRSTGNAPRGIRGRAGLVHDELQLARQPTIHFGRQLIDGLLRFRSRQAITLVT
jgi:hypothetical protein